MSEARAVAPHGAFESDHSTVAVLSLSAGVAIFSLQDIAVKWLSDGYALTEIVFIRSLVGAPLLLLMVLLGRTPPTLRTRRPLLHFVRTALMFISYISFYMALTAFPLAEAVAIGFSSPLVITIFSVIFFGDRVGVQRWGAVFVGFVGVLLITKPGGAAFEPAALLALLCAFTYAVSQMLSRKLGRDDSSALMSLYAATFYLIVSGLLGLLLGDGAFATSVHPSIEFLLRAWRVPTTFDFALMLGAGVISAFGFFLLAQAYRLGEPSVVAPFEYTGLIWASIWGFAIWAEVPNGMSIAGIVLIVAAGLFVLMRERRLDRPLVSKRGRLRMRSGY